MSEDVLEKAKIFVKDHKTEIIIAGTSAVVIAGVVICARYHVKQLKIMNHAKDVRIKNLEKVCAAQDLRINELEGLCARKDNVFKAVISDSLKHGSSEAGRHMAERKAFLHHMVS